MSAIFSDSRHSRRFSSQAGSACAWSGSMNTPLRRYPRTTPSLSSTNVREAVEPGFLLSAQRGSVERICRGLDGLPLAVELAAVRVKALSTDELLSRLARS